MSRYVIGYVGRETRDGRTLRDAPTCEGRVPVRHYGTEDLLGFAHDLRVDAAGVITIETAVQIDVERQVLSLDLVGGHLDLGDPSAPLELAGDGGYRVGIVGTRLAGLAVIDRPTWAWSDVPRGTS